MLAKKLIKKILILTSIQQERYSLSIFTKILINSKINRQNQTDNFINVGDLRWASIKSLSSYKEFNKDISKNGYSFIEVKSNEYIDLNSESDWKIALQRFKNDTYIRY